MTYECNLIKYFIIYTEKDLKPKETQAFNAHTNASKQIERMNLFVQPVNEQIKVIRVNQYY